MIFSPWIECVFSFFHLAVQKTSVLRHTWARTTKQAECYHLYQICGALPFTRRSFWILLFPIAFPQRRSENITRSLLHFPIRDTIMSISNMYTDHFILQILPYYIYHFSSYLQMKNQHQHTPSLVFFCQVFHLDLLKSLQKNQTLRDNNHSTRYNIYCTEAIFITSAVPLMLSFLLGLLSLLCLSGLKHNS